jgi:hypothetical protein
MGTMMRMSVAAKTSARTAAAAERGVVWKEGAGIMMTGGNAMRQDEASSFCCFAPGHNYDEGCANKCHAPDVMLLRRLLAHTPKRTSSGSKRQQRIGSFRVVSQKSFLRLEKVEQFSASKVKFIRGYALFWVSNAKIISEIPL